MSAHRVEGDADAVEARLRAIREKGDLSLAFGPEADRELRRLRRERGADLRAAFARGWLYWYRQLTLPDGAVGADGRRAYAELMPCFIEGMEPIPEGLFPDIAIGSAHQAALRLNRALATRDAQAIVAAAALWRRIQAAVPTSAPEWPRVMIMFCVALQGSFEVTGEIADLDEGIDAGRRGIAAVPADDPRLAELLANFAAALRMRFEVSGDAGRRYADEAIAVYRQAITAIPRARAERAGMLSSLAAALRARFTAYHDEADLTEAVEVARQAVDTAKTLDPNAPRYLANLAVALQARYAVHGDDQDLTQSIAAFRGALSGTRRGHPDRAGHCANLAAGLWSRYEDSGAPEDLEEAIGLLREAADRVRGGDPARALILGNLSVAVWGRFRLAGATGDLDAAIATGRTAIEELPAGSAIAPRYESNLCGFLRERGDTAAAVEAGQRAVAMTAPGDQELPRRLTNLANAQRDAGDLSAAIGTLRLAVRAGGQELPLIQSDLGLALDGAGHVDEAIVTLRAALAGARDDHPGRPGLQANLGMALRHRFTMSGSPADRDAAAALFAEVARTAYAAPSLRARAARAACADADLADDGQRLRAAGLLESAVGLLPAIAPRRLGRRDQQKYLADFGGLASDAAALVLASGGDGSAARALGLLEAGRGVLLSQALETRTDLAPLRRLHPRLAARYERLLGLLDAEDTDHTYLTDHTGPTGHAEQVATGFGAAALHRERLAGDRQRHAAAFAATVAEIRELAGFSGFMLPPALDDLTSQARHGPLAVLNVSAHRSDALLVAPHGVTSVPLPELTPGAVRAAVLRLRHDTGEALAHILDWLWEAAAGPVLDALGFASPAAGEPLPRMWWVPTGPLNLLPIHAAGQVMGRVISSYAPTIRALAHARAVPAVGAAPRSLVVSMPSSPGGAGRLPGAAKEARELSTLLPSVTVLREPAKAQVLRGLDGRAIAHFACHGVTDPADPSRSGLILADEPLTVSDLAPVRLAAARLAYLSACSTAVSEDERLADEAIHITSALQLAGFPHVVGTLWPVGDTAARDFAVAFHTALRTRPGGFEPARAAQALHETASRMRAAFGSHPKRWAGYIHVGA